MSFQAVVSAQQAPRDVNSLKEIVSYSLKRLARELGMDENGETWAAFLSLPKEKQAESVAAKLKEYDAKYGTGGAPVAAPEAPVAAAPPVAAPVEAPAVVEAPATTKPRKTPARSTPTPEAPVAVTNGVAAPVDGALLEMVRQRFDTFETAFSAYNRNISTLITQGGITDAEKRLTTQVAAVSKEVTEMKQAITGMAKVVMFLAENLLEGVSRQEIVRDALEDSTGVDALFGKTGK
jgi:hypothetical protein